MPQGAHLLIIVNKTSTDRSLSTLSDQKCSEYQINLKINGHKTRLVFFPPNKILLYQTSVIEDILESIIIPSSALSYQPYGFLFLYNVLAYLLILFVSTSDGLTLQCLRLALWPQAAEWLSFFPSSNTPVTL